MIITIIFLKLDYNIILIVRVIEKSEKEKDAQKMHNNLVDITNRLFGEKFIVTSNLGIGLFKKPYQIMSKQVISVNTIFNQREISIKNPEYLNDAMSLAEAYEKSGEQEFTIKKDYD